MTMPTVGHVLEKRRKCASSRLSQGSRMGFPVIGYQCPHQKLNHSHVISKTRMKTKSGWTRERAETKRRRLGEKERDKEATSLIPFSSFPIVMRCSRWLSHHFQCHLSVAESIPSCFSRNHHFGVLFKKIAQYRKISGRFILHTDEERTSIQSKPYTFVPTWKHPSVPEKQWQRTMMRDRSWFPANRCFQGGMAQYGLF